MRKSIVMVAILGLAGAAWIAFGGIDAPPIPAGAPVRDIPKLRNEVAVGDAGAMSRPPFEGPATGAPTLAKAAGTDGPAPEEETWESLKARADRGDTNASCRLSLKLEGCRLAREARQRIAAEIEQLAAIGAADVDEQIAMRLSNNEAERAGYESRCGQVPPGVVMQEWQYLLRAAQAGHEPSMYRFVTAPPIDDSRPLEYVEALQAYRQHASTFVDELLRRGSAEGIVAALLIAVGHPIVGQSPLRPRDPGRMVQLASALALLRNKPGILTSTLSNAAEELTPGDIERARAEGERLAPNFSFRFADTTVGVVVDRQPDSCDTDWASVGESER
jgi:hypothetical protein